MDFYFHKLKNVVNVLEKSFNSFLNNEMIMIQKKTMVDVDLIMLSGDCGKYSAGITLDKISK